MRFEIGAPVSHSRRPGMHLSRDPDPCLALRTPPSSRYAIVRRALFPSGKLFKLTIVLEPFRMRFEMPGSIPASPRYALEPGSIPASPRYAVVRRAFFPSGKLFKLTIVLELFRMRFEMPGPIL